jgi:pyrimidine operon attenuation protein/uracil phosphoribosyltransferase
MSAQILDPKKAHQKIRRIALEILERNQNEPNLIIAGVMQTGYDLAQLICEELKYFSGIEYPCHAIHIFKPAPLEKSVICDVEPADLNSAVLILVDDVQNSGKTMAYALRYFLDFPVKAIQTCVLIDRRHNSFPVRADYVGLSLSTTLHEHVSVEKGNDGFWVSLS